MKLITIESGLDIPKQFIDEYDGLRLEHHIKNLMIMATEFGFSQMIGDATIGLVRQDLIYVYASKWNLTITEGHFRQIKLDDIL